MRRYSKKVVVQESGFALVLTLALIVLMTFAVVAYFSRATTNRRIESATSAAAKADTLARSATQIILSDLKSEIVGGSEINQASSAQMPIYRPLDAQKAVPSRALAQALMLSDITFNSLVKQSSNRFFPATGYSGSPLILSSTGRDTTIASANNRNVSIARWNAPVLNTGSGFSTANQVPRWILIDRQGLAPNQSWDNIFRDYTPGNDNAIVGRFGFNVYDVGGLLDANVAGYPIFSTPLTSAQIQQLKSTEAGAYFYDSFGPILPDFNQARQTAFVNAWKFRTAGTSSSTNFFADFMSRTIPPSSTVPTTMAHSGFMQPTVAPNRTTNQLMTSSESNTIAYSRQDLIRLTEASAGYLTPLGLAYFTHFSRELNAPSWYPQQNASDLGGNNGSGSPAPFAYFTNRDDASVGNRNMSNVRVQSAFTRTDGTPAIIGEPLIKNRFPLRRLDGISSAGVNATGFPVMMAGTLQYPGTTTIQRDFGLLWDNTNNRWVYNSPNPTRYNPPTSTIVDPGGSGGGDYDPATGSGSPANAIKNLAQVAAEKREPDCFEILKAFILTGSVGLGTDNTGAARTFVDAEPRYYQQPSSSDSQIIQIGANMIDQWDGDKNPTFIYFGPDEYAGVENVPFLSKLVFQPLWTTGTGAKFKTWIIPSFWMPAQNGTTPGTATVRFIMTSGTVSATVYAGSTSANSTPRTANRLDSTTQPYTNLSISRAFGPDPNSSAYGTGASPLRQLMTGAPNNSSGSALGIEMVFSSTPGITSATTTKALPIFTNATFEMQIQIGSVWKTYQRWSGCTSATAACEPPAGYNWTSTSPNTYDPEFVLLDPRAMRFGVWGSDAKSTGTADFTRGLVDTLDRTSVGFQGISSMGPQGTNFTGVGAQMANNTLSSPSYKDLDGLKRAGDIRSSGDTSAMLPANTADRPPGLGSGNTVVSGRQIRTDAELGTVFRDQPWKTLNFTTADSGDAGLLDAFTIFEPNSVFRSDLVAGKISLNTRQAPVLRAVLAGVTKSTADATGTSLISASERDAVVDDLIAMTSVQPMINKSELVTRLAAAPSVTVLGSKEKREAVIRALSDVGQTRTWNLTIDVIAQSGKFAADAADVDKFVVQGEKRYWLHLAIDRYTGEVIDQQLEKINE